MWFVVKRTLVVSLVLAGVALLAGWWSYRLTLRGALDRLTAEATLLAEHAGRSLVGIDVALTELVAQIEAEWRNGRPPDVRFHDELRQQVDRLPQVTGMQVIDAERRLVADQISPKRSGVAVARRSYFTEFAEGRDPRLMYYGDPVRGRFTGTASSTASYALVAPDGAFGGVVTATFDPFYYRRSYQKLNLPVHRHDVALVDEQGLVLASLSDLSGVAGVVRDLPGGGHAIRSASESGGSLRLSLPSGARYLASFAPVPGFPLDAFVGIRESAVLADWRSLAAGLALAWLIGTLGSGAAFISIWRREEQRKMAFAALERAGRNTREALERAEAASAAKSRFLAHMSHELRTPLNAILGFSEVIRDRMIESDPVRDSEYAALIHNSGSHLLQIINDLLDLSKIEAGRMPLRCELLDVPELLENASYLASRDLVDRDVAIATAVAPACPQLYADQRAAKQILVNLLSNAAKFSHSGGRVELRAEPRPDGGVTLSVQDWGRGIPPAKLEFLFEPFGVAGGEVADERQGTGLGLPLVKSLMEQHGGGIAVDSREGAGTTVTLSFPAARAEAAAADPPPRVAVRAGQ